MDNSIRLMMEYIFFLSPSLFCNSKIRYCQSFSTLIHHNVTEYLNWWISVRCCLQVVGILGNVCRYQWFVLLCVWIQWEHGPTSMAGWAALIRKGPPLINRPERTSSDTLLGKSASFWSVNLMILGFQVRERTIFYAYLIILAPYCTPYRYLAFTKNRY